MPQDTPSSGMLNEAAHYRLVVLSGLSDLGACGQCEYVAVQAHFSNNSCSQLSLVAQNIGPQGTAVKKGNQHHLTC